MDNGAKAMIMVASVILALMLFTIMIYMFNAGARVNKAVDQKQITAQLELYNSKFLLYDRPANTIMDIITVANMAFDVNVDNNYDIADAVKIDVKIGNKTYTIPNTLNVDGTPALSKRNMIKEGSSEIPIYNLLSVSLKDLGITKIDGKTISEESKNDFLTKTTYDMSNNKTIYKYLFKSDSTKTIFSETSGKVIRLYFEAYENSEFEE